MGWILQTLTLCIATPRTGSLQHEAHSPPPSASPWFLCSPHPPPPLLCHRFCKSSPSSLTVCFVQVLIVGDLNIAASQQDVHEKLDREAMYSAHEKNLFDSLLADFTDIWRQQHPDTANSFTVWDEKTNARAFNEVCTTVAWSLAVSSAVAGARNTRRPTCVSVLYV